MSTGGPFLMLCVSKQDRTVRTTRGTFNVWISLLFEPSLPLQTLPAHPRISSTVPENVIHPAWTYHNFHRGILSSVCNAWKGTGQWFFYMGAGSRQGTPWHQNQPGSPESVCGGKVLSQTTWLIRHTSAIGPKIINSWRLDRSLQCTRIQEWVTFCPQASQWQKVS